MTPESTMLYLFNILLPKRGTPDNKHDFIIKYLEVLKDADIAKNEDPWRPGYIIRSYYNEIVDDRRRAERENNKTSKHVECINNQLHPKEIPTDKFLELEDFCESIKNVLTNLNLYISEELCFIYLIDHQLDFPGNNENDKNRYLASRTNYYIDARKCFKKKIKFCVKNQIPNAILNDSYTYNSKIIEDIINIYPSNQHVEKNINKEIVLSAEFKVEIIKLFCMSRDIKTVDEKYLKKASSVISRKRYVYRTLLVPIVKERTLHGKHRKFN